MISLIFERASLGSLPEGFYYSGFFHLHTFCIILGADRVLYKMIHTEFSLQWMVNNTPTFSECHHERNVTWSHSLLLNIAQPTMFTAPDNYRISLLSLCEDRFLMFWASKWESLIFCPVMWYLQVFSKGVFIIFL